MSFFSKLTKEFEGLQSNFSKEKPQDDGAAQRGYGEFFPGFQNAAEGYLDQPRPPPRLVSLHSLHLPQTPTSSIRTRQKNPGTRDRN